MVMRFTEVKEKIIKNKAINSTDKVKGRHRAKKVARKTDMEKMVQI